jgi:hypothetical protein
LPIRFRNQHSRHEYQVPVLEYETWADLFVAAQQLLEEYHSRCLAHPRLASLGVGVSDTAWVFMVKLHLSLMGMSWPMIWPMIEVQAQPRSAIQSRMTFLDFNEVNFGKLQLIVNVSIQVRHASTAIIRLRSACSPLHSALYILVCFLLIMFSSALNQWTLCTQIVISQDTAHLGAGGTSSSPSANILIYA